LSSPQLQYVKIAGTMQHDAVRRGSSETELHVFTLHWHVMWSEEASQGLFVCVCAFIMAKAEFCYSLEVME